MIIYRPAWGNTAGMYPIVVDGFAVRGLNGSDLAAHRAAGLTEIPVTSDLWRQVVNEANEVLGR